MGDGEGTLPKTPDWLPEGWTIKIRTRKDGKMDRYYISPVSGRTFRSKVEVMRFMNAEKGNDDLIVTTARHKEENASRTGCYEDHLCDVAQMSSSRKWLPLGWIVKSRSGQNGSNAGKKYKCYIDPSTGSSFYSKAEVLRYLKMEKSPNSLPKRKKLLDTELKEESNSVSNQKSMNSDLKDDIVTLIETSPDGLPPGWITEVKCKKTATGVRKDRYYTDPISGYTFRSKKDVFRYIETGNLGKYAFRSKSKGCAKEMFLPENISPSPLSSKKLKSEGDKGSQVQECLLEGKLRKSSRNTMKEKNRLHDHLFSPATNKLLQCELSSGSRCETASGSTFLNDKSVKPGSLFNLPENELPEKPLAEADEEALEQVIEKLLHSVSKSAPCSSDAKLLNPVSGNLQSSSNTALSVEKNEAHLNIPADKSLEPPLKWHLELSGTKTENMDKWKAVEFTETVQLSNQKSQNLKTWSMEIVKENGELSRPSEEHMRENLLEPNETKCGEMSGQGTEESKEDISKTSTRTARPRKSRVKPDKSVLITRRASKRLAGVEADPVIDIELGDKSLKRGRSSTRENFRAELDVETPKSKEETLSEQVEALTPEPDDEGPRKHGDAEQDGSGRAADEDLDCKVASPFGDSWPDPCIEFAFKTLTGEIPVLDTTPMQGSLHEQPSTVQTPSPAGGFPVERTQRAQTQVNCASERHSLTDNNTLPTLMVKVKRLSCRRRK